MTPEAIIAAATAVGSIVAWLWKTHERVTTLGLQQGITAATVAELKTELRDLRDSHVRMDTQLGAVLTQLGKLDRIERIDANTESTKNDVAELKQQVIPREALEARFKAIEDRLP
jgi:hypothetical protein